MVNKITVTIYTELSRYGEVVFAVKSYDGTFRNKCLHDALSEAGIKMTGITDMVQSLDRQLRTVTHFSLETNHTRIYDIKRKTISRDERSDENLHSTDEDSVLNVSGKSRKSTSGNKKKEKVNVPDCV
jgi:hypothetical protein